MPIFTFSVKRKDADAINELKEYCERTHRSFSALVSEQLHRYNKERKDGQRD